MDLRHKRPNGRIGSRVVQLGFLIAVIVLWHLATTEWGVSGILLPKPAAVLHELTHLEEFNHSPAFKRKLAKVCPDFRQREKELDYISPAELSHI